MPIFEPLAAQGYSIIALDAPITDEATANDWREHLDFVSNQVEQNDAILIVPFADIDAARTFANYQTVKTSYRFVTVCYHGATGKEPEIAASVAAAITAESDPALPFNGVQLPALPVVEPQYRRTKTQIEQALQAGVAMIDLDASNTPSIVRLITSYRIDPQTGLADDIALDVNATLIIRYVRREMRRVINKNKRRKNTVRARRDLRSELLTLAVKLDEAEILENVRESQKELTVEQDTTDKTRVKVRMPAYWVRGMHIVDAQIDIY